MGEFLGCKLQAVIGVSSVCPLGAPFFFNGRIIKWVSPGVVHGSPAGLGVPPYGFKCQDS